jgi:hypothetical protein
MLVTIGLEDDKLQRFSRYYSTMSSVVLECRPLPKKGTSKLLLLLLIHYKTIIVLIL